MTEKFVIDEFVAAMRAQDIPVDEPIIADGRLHRYHVEGDRGRDRNAWAVLHIDEYPAGEFGCNKRFNGTKFPWSMKGTRGLTAAERVTLKKKAKLRASLRQAEEDVSHAEAAQKALAIYNAAAPVTHYQYLTDKGVPSCPKLRVGPWYYTDEDTGEEILVTDNALIVPMMVSTTRIMSIQAIIPDARERSGFRKQFMKRGLTGGTFMMIGESKDGVILICEGLATGLSLWQCTEHGVLVAFCSGNLDPVARQVRERRPDTRILICADNDCWKGPKNPGITAAREAAVKNGTLVVVPEFLNTDTKPTDFNDLHQLEGVEAVRLAIHNALIQGQADESANDIAADKMESDTSADTHVDNNETAELLRPEELELAEFLHRFIQVGKGLIIADLLKHGLIWTRVEFHAAFAHCQEIFDKKAVPRTKLWAQDRRRKYVDILTFDPAQPQFFGDQKKTHLNLWTPPVWKSVDTALADGFFEHLNFVIPDATARRDFLDWLAHVVQYPGVRPHHQFLLVATEEGVGRGFIGEVIRRLWGHHSGETDLHRLLDDPFNSELSAKVLMVVNEVKAPASDRYAHKERLKSLFTDLWIRINEKNLARWDERFVARFLMFTNREDALPLNEGDRRVYVVRCADKPRDASYYTDLYERLKDQDFLAAIWTTLAERDISNFNPGRRAPLNEMKVQMIAAGRTEDQQSAVEFCDVCPFSVVAAVDLMQVVVPPLSGEHPRERRARMITVTAVLRETGRQTHAKKIRLGQDTTRAWIFRDATKWSACTPASITAEAAKAREAFDSMFWDAEILMQAWSNAG